MSVAFFDLDRTLIDCNSGRLWLQHEWRLGNVSLRQGAWATWWLAKYSVGLGDGLADVFDTLARSLEGLEERELDDRIRVWFAQEVAGRLRPGAEMALRHHRERGDRLVVATSSSPYAGRCAQEAFGLDEVLSSVFGVDETGRFTGRMTETAVGGGKARLAARWASEQGMSLADATFYSDSATDLALLEAVGRPVAVNPDRALRREAARRGWPIVDWGAVGRV